jgi:hypothetical protein
MFFSGFQPQEQASFVGTKYLPALAGVESSLQQRKLSLEDQMNKLKGAQMQQAQGSYAAKIAEQNRQREAEINRQQQMQIAQMRIAASRSGGGGGGGKEVDPLSEFGSFIDTQFKRAGGQGNTNISRQQQDKWVNQWLDSKGVSDNRARQVYWDRINATYNRPNNPYADPRYRR